MRAREQGRENREKEKKEIKKKCKSLGEYEPILPMWVPYSDPQGRIQDL